MCHRMLALWQCESAAIDSVLTWNGLVGLEQRLKKANQRMRRVVRRLETEERKAEREKLEKARARRKCS